MVGHLSGLGSGKASVQGAGGDWREGNDLNQGGWQDPDPGWWPVRLQSRQEEDIVGALTQVGLGRAKTYNPRAYTALESQ